jgi:hypothetical protein
MEYIPRVEIPKDLDEFTRGYLECAEWCGIDEEERKAFELSVSPKWGNLTLQRAIQDCDDFRSAAGGLLNSTQYPYGDSYAGHDFWLTRNRHGAGFWDRGLGKVGETLTELAHPYGEAWVVFDPEEELLSIYPE